MQSVDRLGIIAGGGEYPLLMARSARAQGVKPIVAVGFEGETSQSVGAVVDELEWVRLGQLNKLIHAFTDREVRHCVMAGQLSPSNLYENIQLDLRMIAVAARLKVRNAESIFGAVADELA